ncbi:MAG: hypothetical protein ACLQVL_18060 [Terriglobia bacterium]
MNSSKFESPTAISVAKACDEFDSDSPWNLIDLALTALFGRYPGNTNPAEVLLKVVTLNNLYSLRIPTFAADRPNVFDIAERIPGLKLDEAFKAGSLEIVSVISTSQFQGKKKINRFSFATKYASWHRQDVYPMWDSNVQRYLTCLRQLCRKDWDKFSEGFKLSSDDWGYPEFHGLMVRFRDFYCLDVSFKDLDKFLWLRGAALK